MTVGEKIRKFRIDQGYTQKELAIMSGLSESAIRNYELGNRFPSSEHRKNSKLIKDQSIRHV